MNNKILISASLLIIFGFIGYMIYDSTRHETDPAESSLKDPVVIDSWSISDEILVNAGKLKAVSITASGEILLAGDSFISLNDNNLNVIWNVMSPAPVTSITCSGDTIFASLIDQILVLNMSGKIINEWGPYEENCYITSVSANRSYVAVADAGNRMVMILDKGGEVIKMYGQNENRFIIPSPYFDITLTGDNSFFVANTGHRRVEKISPDGTTESWFGESGMAPGAFCGCCNPAHFVKIPGGYITAEKGINRIKILDNQGKFVEFVCSTNNFEPSIPLDLASNDGKTIYAANPDDSKLYVFKRE